MKKLGYLLILIGVFIPIISFPLAKYGGTSDWAAHARLEGTLKSAGLLTKLQLLRVVLWTSPSWEYFEPLVLMPEGKRMPLGKFRVEYPMYHDLSDDLLAEELHRKYGSAKPILMITVDDGKSSKLIQFPEDMTIQEAARVVLTQMLNKKESEVAKIIKAIPQDKAEWKDWKCATPIDRDSVTVKYRNLLVLGIILIFAGGCLLIFRKR